MTDKTPVFGGEGYEGHGHPKTVALALRAEHMPIDAMGYPIGKTEDDIIKVIRKPIGVSVDEWKTALEVATEYFRMTQGLMPIRREPLEALSELPTMVWTRIYHESFINEWHAALALRGIMKKGAGLTHDQMRALRYLTDVTQRGTLETRLKHLGVKWDMFQSWMRDSKFKEQFRQISEDVYEQAQPLVAMELTRGAISGRMDAIKYFHEITGRFNGAVSAADMKAFVEGLVELLQLEISDKDQLERIGRRLKKLKETTLDQGGLFNG